MNKELLEKRYFIEGESTWEDLVRRVAKHGSNNLDEYYRAVDAIYNCDFIPSRMPYMGTDKPFSSSCFVFEIEDNFESIFETLHDACAVSRWGGGWGTYFSTLRPKGDMISTTKGEASGPISFMRLFDDAMHVIKRAGKKHAAQMAIMDVSHPDIEEFITCKNVENELSTFNISVAVTDDFMRAVNEDADWDLTFGGKVYKTVSAKALYQKICENAWRNGDPGIIYKDAVDRGNLFSDPVAGHNACKLHCKLSV